MLSAAAVIRHTFVSRFNPTLAVCRFVFNFIRVPRAATDDLDYDGSIKLRILAVGLLADPKTPNLEVV